MSSTLARPFGNRAIARRRAISGTRHSRATWFRSGESPGDPDLGAFYLPYRFCAVTLFTSGCDTAAPSISEEATSVSNNRLCISPQSGAGHRMDAQAQEAALGSRSPRAGAGSRETATGPPGGCPRRARRRARHGRSGSERRRGWSGRTRAMAASPTSREGSRCGAIRLRSRRPVGSPDWHRPAWALATGPAPAPDRRPRRSS